MYSESSETKEMLITTAKNAKIDLSKIPRVKNENRTKQWVSTRLLVNHFFTKTTISYDHLGKPFLSNGWNISISHSGNYVAIVLNKTENCGVDIEKIATKVDRIKHKFLNATDLQNLQTTEELTIYWGAKEALYKYYGKKEVLFIEHLFIEDFSLQSDEFKGTIKMPSFEKKIAMNWEKIDDYTLVYTL